MHCSAARRCLSPGSASRRVTGKPTSSVKLGLFSSSSPSLSLSPSLFLSSLSILTCSCRRLGRSRAGRHRVVGIPRHSLSFLPFSIPPPGSPFLSPTRSPIRDGSPALVLSLSLSLLALASAKWEKSQPPPKLRLRLGHARHPPSPLLLSLPLFSPPSLPSTHLTLSPPPFFPPRVVVVAADHRYRLRPGHGHRPPPLPPPLPFFSSPSLSALPPSPSARPPPCPCP